MFCERPIRTHPLIQNERAKEGDQDRRSIAAIAASERDDDDDGCLVDEQRFDDDNGYGGGYVDKRRVS